VCLHWWNRFHSLRGPMESNSARAQRRAAFSSTVAVLLATVGCPQPAPTPPEVEANDDPCVVREECRTEGRCKTRAGRCVVANSVDCFRSVDCLRAGKCSYGRSRCIALSDADCRQSGFCRQTGACTAHSGECVVSADDDCRASVGCDLAGSCSAVGSGANWRCAPASAADCERSYQCKKHLYCLFEDGSCVPPGISE